MLGRHASGQKGIWVQPYEKYFLNALEAVNMDKCNASTSPKLDKAHLDGDDEPHPTPEKYRSSVCSLLYLSKRRYRALYSGSASALRRLR